MEDLLLFQHLAIPASELELHFEEACSQVPDSCKCVPTISAGSPAEIPLKDPLIDPLSSPRPHPWIPASSSFWKESVFDWVKDQMGIPALRQWPQHAVERKTAACFWQDLRGPVE